VNRLIGGIAVTIPACWYLWPAPHADSGHHGDHGDHAELGEDDHTEDKVESEDAAGEEAPKVEEEAKDAGEADPKESEGEDTGSAPPTDEAKPKEGGEGADANKGKISPDSEGSENSRKVESDSKGGNKIRVDSGLQKDLGKSDEHFDEDGSEKVRSLARFASTDQILTSSCRRPRLRNLSKGARVRSLANNLVSRTRQQGTRLRLTRIRKSPRSLKVDLILPRRWGRSIRTDLRCKKWKQ
jgi:hypothetical protein